MLNHHRKRAPSPAVNDSAGSPPPHHHESLCGEAAPISIIDNNQCSSIARLIRDVIFPSVKSSAIRMLLLLLPACAFAANSVVNMSHYDLMRPDFVGMASEGIVGVIHEATYPRRERDARYYERQRAALEAGLLWGAYHFGDATNPVGQADHFLSAVAAARPPIR